MCESEQKKLLKAVNDIINAKTPAEILCCYNIFIDLINKKEKKEEDKK